LGVKNSLSYVAEGKTRVLNNQSRGRRSVIISYVIIIFYRRDRKLDAKYNNNTRATHTHTHTIASLTINITRLIVCMFRKTHRGPPRYVRYLIKLRGHTVIVLEWIEIKQNSYYGTCFYNMYISKSAEIMTYLSGGSVI